MSKSSKKSNSSSMEKNEDLSQLEGIAQVANGRSLFSKIKSWSRSQLLAPFTVGAGCCAREIMRLEGPNPQSHFIRERFNHERVEYCDILIVSGVINEKLSPYILRVYEKMMEPKYCVAVGTCSATGAIFDTMAIDELIPVDVYIPGCPPSMDALVGGIEILRSKVAKGESRAELLKLQANQPPEEASL
ncbi:MAG: hypothetical protein CME63_05985 [Halobacteriovoraceae bacterium]|nr:hypothetical protein [Halobacteriovoraceae bacterium]|tara:strand:- start:1047 stop:1613 length:567 start_codon:yes stop_codon:yes gene_type:complete